MSSFTQRSHMGWRGRASRNTNQQKSTYPTGSRNIPEARANTSPAKLCKFLQEHRGNTWTERSGAEPHKPRGSSSSPRPGARALAGLTGPAGAPQPRRPRSHRPGTGGAPRPREHEPRTSSWGRRLRAPLQLRGECAGADGREGGRGEESERAARQDPTARTGTVEAAAAPQRGPCGPGAAREARLPPAAGPRGAAGWQRCSGTSRPGGARTESRRGGVDGLAPSLPPS